MSGISLPNWALRTGPMPWRSASNAESSISNGTTSLERGMSTRPFEGVAPPRKLNRIEWGCVLQRLFSTFPNSWPGVGLVLLRLCLAIALFYFGIVRRSNSWETIAFTQELIAALGGIFLLAGLWTPAMGALVALDEVWIAFLSS